MRHDIHFNFDGKWSYNMGITKVNVEGGLFEDQLVSSKKIIEEKISGRDRPYFYGVENSPLSFPLSIFFDQNLNTTKIREILRWLDKEDYRPFYMEKNRGRRWYAMVIDDINTIHNGIKSGFITLNIRTDDIRTLTPYTTSDLYQFRDNTSKIIEFENSGDFNCKPIIHIKKYGDGDISIKNLSNNNGEFKFCELQDTEHIMVDCENKDIVTDGLEYRYDYFSGDYLEFVRGVNRLKVIGDFDMQFETEFKVY